MPAGMLPGLFSPVSRQEDQEDESNLQNLAKMDPFEQARYATLASSRMAGRGLGSAVAVAAGADPRTQAEKDKPALDKVRAQLSTSQLKPGSDEYWEFVISKFQENGLLDRAQAAETAYRDEKLKRAQAGQAERAHVPELVLRLQEVQKLRQQNPGDATLAKAEEKIKSLLGQPKEGEWKVVNATEHSPGYQYHSVTGEIKELKGTPAGDGGPFAGLEPGMKKSAEKVAGAETARWVGGARDSSLRGVEALRDVAKQLQDNPDLVNDPLSSYLPDGVRALTEGGREALDARDTVRTAIQHTLREVMGAQYTEKEGLAMFNRAWDPKLGVKENLGRLNRAITELEGKIASKDSLASNKAPARRPVGAPPAPAGAGGERIKVVSPDGQSGTIPRANLQRALQSGYKVVGK